VRIYVNGVQQGGSAGIPGTPAEVLLNAGAPSTFVALDADGEGTQLSYATARTALSVPTLPATPAGVLLDAGSPSTIVGLNGSGVGAALSYATARTALGVLNAANIPLRSSLASTETSVGYDVLAWQNVNPASFARAGLTTAFTFQASGRVSPGVTGTLVLYSVTAGAAVATLSWTETDLVNKTISMTVPLVETEYELRFSMSGGTSGSLAFVSGVSIEVTWS